MITSEEFIFKIITQDYDGVKKAISEGFDVNTEMPGKVAIIESAQPAEDYKMLHILWEAGAIPTTPWLKDIFSEFEQGRFLQREKKKLPFIIKKFNSKNFSVKKLRIPNGSLYLNEDHYSIEMPLEPFELDGEIVETSIFIEDISLPTSINDIKNKEFTFPDYPQQGYLDSSIYLKNVHNSITVRRIVFGKYSEGSYTIKVSLDLEFNFEIIDMKCNRFELSTLLTIN